ncbi:MAG: hypothetical protein JKY08_05440 [Flavobacteriaceae bacterium]|nr:hypothetical protein [Flavobacteriaceae bacterium]
MEINSQQKNTRPARKKTTTNPLKRAKTLEAQARLNLKGWLGKGGKRSRSDEFKYFLIFLEFIEQKGISDLDKISRANVLEYYRTLENDNMAPKQQYNHYLVIKRTLKMKLPEPRQWTEIKNIKNHELATKTLHEKFNYLSTEELITQMKVIDDILTDRKR